MLRQKIINVLDESVRCLIVVCDLIHVSLSRYGMYFMAIVVEKGHSMEGPMPPISGTVIDQSRDPNATDMTEGVSEVDFE